MEELYNSKVKIVGEEENQEEKLEEGLDGDFDEDTEIWERTLWSQEGSISMDILPHCPGKLRDGVVILY